MLKDAQDLKKTCMRRRRGHKNPDLKLTNEVGKFDRHHTTRLFVSIVFYMYMYIM